MEGPPDFTDESHPSLFYGEDYGVESYDDIYPLEEQGVTILVEIDKKVVEQKLVSRRNLQHNWWYQEILNGLSFKIRGIRPDRPFSDILLDYHRCLEGLAEDDDISRSVLRFELRQAVKSQNSAIAGRVKLYLPGLYDYKHVRRCPKSDSKYLALDLDPEKVLSYKAEPSDLYFKLGWSAGGDKRR